jgi:hypothetical protein
VNSYGSVCNVWVTDQKLNQVAKAVKELEVECGVVCVCVCAAACHQDLVLQQLPVFGRLHRPVLGHCKDR